jgi:predicted enzyme related to lactoylglutathione lyase
MAQFRYIVNDVDQAIEFYTGKLSFVLDQQYGPAMAILSKDDIQLWLAGPLASASKPMPDGSKPGPGGWNRIVIVVEDLDDLSAKLKTDGVVFRNEIIEGPGGRQILCADPSGNIVELFEPA